jgi:hypothetical protein
MVCTECTKAFFSFIMTPIFTACSVSYKGEGRLFCADFYEAYKYSTTLCAHAYTELNPNRKISVEYTCGDLFSPLGTA